MFTFVVTCYQQADVIAHALESVAYQIEHYGQGQQFQLIVTDDFSTDSSRSVVRQWVEKKGGLFVKTDLLFAEENMGICRIYAWALRRVEGDTFFVLNGDDLLSPYNIFELTGKLAAYDIAVPAFLKFTGSGNMITTPRTYLEVVLQHVIRGKTLRRAAQLGCPIMGVAAYRRPLLTEEVFSHILRFRTVNDRACFQKILEQNEDISVCYLNIPMVLYRISHTSLSNFNSPNRILHNQEIALMCKIQRSSEKSPVFRLLLLLQEKSNGFRGSRNYFVRLLRFFSPYFAIMLWLYIRHFRLLRTMERQLTGQHWRECEAHYRTIAARAAAVLCERSTL